MSDVMTVVETEGRKRFRFEADIWLDSGEIAAADGNIEEAIQRRLAHPSVGATVRSDAWLDDGK